MNKLALLGGTPIRTKLFPAYNPIGDEEKRAVLRVLDSGNLSQFLGAWHSDFFGGPEVRRFEEHWSEYFRVKHSISVNSNTSGLICAMGALGLRQGDEVVVSPYSMSASAVAPLIYGATPVFADIDASTFCISPDAFKKAITPKTKAIIIVHIFGHPADMDTILKIAADHKIRVVEDAAQSPGVNYKGALLGTLGDIGVFSLNYHKHIHTGEGGVVVTQNDELAERIQLIRNHGENIVGPKKTKGDLFNTWGFNFRMPEIEAAMGVEQLKKLSKLMSSRFERAQLISQRLKSFDGLVPPVVESGSGHGFYMHAIKLKKNQTLFSRNAFVKALSAELPSAILRETTPMIGAGYVKPLYLLPLFQEALAVGVGHKSRYQKGMCPVEERMHFEELWTHEYIKPNLSEVDLNDFFNAVYKIFDCKDELIQWDEAQSV